MVRRLSVSCKTSEEFAKAVKNNEEVIIIEGDLKNHVLRIKATGKVAWGVCFGALAVAIVALLASPGAAVVTGGPGGAALVAGGVAAAGVAATTLGSAATTAIAIGVAAGGAGILNRLRDKYKIVEKNDKYMKLQRK